MAAGVSWISRLPQARTFACTVAGSGPDLPVLRKVVWGVASSLWSNSLEKFSPDRVPLRLNSHGSSWMPSRFEGFPYGLLEAMAAGCVPVASRIHGVTDFVVQHGRTGFLFPMGSPRAAAECLARLAWDPGLSCHERRGARRREGEIQPCTANRTLCGADPGVLRAPRPIREQVALENWSVPRGFRPGWWYWLPCRPRTRCGWRGSGSSGREDP